MAEQTGVEVFGFPLVNQAWINSHTPPPEAENRWRTIYEKVRNIYHGRVALNDYVCCGAFDEGVGENLKSKIFEEDSPFLGEFDFFMLSLWNPLTRTDDPSQAELDQNAALILDDKLKHLFKRYQKPIVLHAAYASADGASRGTAKYPVDLVNNPDWSDKVTVELELGGLFGKRETFAGERPIFTYDATEQAMIYEALLKAVAEREWIVGFYPFIYHMVGFDFPRHPDHDLRRKPAETILANWYSAFKNEQR